jgi:protein-S-isoprenylcysteine O-methyltransferase Ste14
MTGSYDNPERTRMIAKLLLQNLIWTAGMGALLFVSAGTLHWPAAWVFLAICGILGLAGGLWLARVDPALLAERMRPLMQDNQPAADKAFVLAIGVCLLVWIIVIGLDARYHAPDALLAMQVVGFVLLWLSSGLVFWVMRENSFAAAVVKIQTERGHRVVSSGPYAWVRHPMYSGTVLFFVGAALLLGSWWGVAMSPLFAVLFAVRIGIEERVLVAGLPGYAGYTAQVRYRLIPGLW